MSLRKYISKLIKIKHKSLDNFSKLLYHYGGYVYDRPYKFIFGSLLCSLILTMGFYYKEHEKDIYRLYSLSNSYAYETNANINDFFYKSRKVSILVESNCNLLEPDILRELKKFEDKIKDIKLDLSNITECNNNSIVQQKQEKVEKEVFNILSKRKDGFMKTLKIEEGKYKLKMLNNGNNKTMPNFDYKEVIGQNDIENSEVTCDTDNGGGNNHKNNKLQEEEEKKINKINSISNKNIFHLKGNATSDTKSHDVNLSDYEGDFFFPYYYIPPMLDKRDRCNLQNVFENKNLNINLREASDDLKMQILYGLEDICEKNNNNDCNFSSLFMYYENNNAQLGDIIETDNLDFYLNRNTFKGICFNLILGNMKYTKEGSKYKITSANAVQTVIPLLSSYTLVPYVLAYEKELIDYVHSYKIDKAVLVDKKTNDDNDPFVRFHVFTDRSLEDEVDRISKIDNLTRLLFLIGVLLILIYTLFNNVTSVLYRSKPLCAVMGIFCGFLGFLSGSGFLYLLGVKSVPPAETVPFLVIGVGVDDIFVILNSYSLLFMIKDDKKRIQMCLKDSALAITVTTLTNIIAFLISAISPFYSICSFSLFTASSLFFGYLMVLTFFLSFLCIEAKLEKQEKTICSGIYSFFCSFFRRNRDQNNAEIPIQDDAESKRKAMEYENISIYQWIHNLYLFEESIDRKKKNIAAFLSNEKSSKGQNNENVIIQNDSLLKKANKGDEKEIEGDKPDGLREENTRNKKNANNDELFQEEQQEEKNTLVEVNPSNNIEKNNNPNIYFENDNNNNEETIKNENNIIINDIEEDMKNNRNVTREYEYGSSLDNYYSASDKKKNNNNNKCKCIFNIFRKNNKGKIVCEGNNKDSHKGVNENKILKGVENKEVEESAYIPNSSNGLATKDTINNMINEPNKNIYLLSSHDNVLFYKYIYKEPKGNIGKYFRSIVKNYYIPFLSSKLGKVIIYITFSIIIALSLYGCTLMKKGIKYEKAFPNDSYVRQFAAAKMKYFPEYGDYIELYYFDKDFINKYRKLSGDVPLVSSSYLYSDRTDRGLMNSANINKNVKWENPDIHQEILNMHERFQSLDFASAVSNGFVIFLSKYMMSKQAGTSVEFYDNFVNWMKTDFLSKSFKDDFIFLNGKLVAWRFHFFQRSIDDTELVSKWLKTCKEIAKIKKYDVQMVCFHFSSIFIETDEAILDVTLKNLGITLISILIVTAYIVKGFYSCLIIALIIFLIDLCIFGFMCLCGITVNIISMVILVLSVGFSIDHTSHIVQAFTHSLGKTRDEKMKEGLHLMIGPVLHSGLSTWFVISTLFFSNKDFTIIFFQTLSLVLFFSVIFSSMFLPVLLSSFGPL